MKYRRLEPRYRTQSLLPYIGRQTKYSKEPAVKMNWNELAQYKTGETPDGNSQFQVTLPQDADEMVGRECKNPDCRTKYFKISGGIPTASKISAEHVTDVELTCPYCGTVEDGNLLFTEVQKEWIKAMMLSAARKTFQDAMGSAVCGSKYISFKADKIPPTPAYVEEKLKRLLSCGTCGFRYAVYGVSIKCPLCGGCDLGQQLAEQQKTICILMAEAGRLRAEHGDAVADSMLKNAIEDVVTMFEGFLRQIYKHAVPKKFPKQEAEKLLKNVRNNFQRIQGAQEIFKSSFSLDILMVLTANELKALALVFAKRHVITHNLGLVDEKIQEEGLAWQREGAEVPLERAEIEHALLYAVRVLTKAAEVLR